MVGQTDLHFPFQNHFKADISCTSLADNWLTADRHRSNCIDLGWVIKTQLPGEKIGSNLHANLIWTKVSASQCKCMQGLSLRAQVDPMDSQVNRIFQHLSTWDSILPGL